MVGIPLCFLKQTREQLQGVNERKSIKNQARLKHRIRKERKMNIIYCGWRKLTME